jgi:hypothetical protein
LIGSRFTLLCEGEISVSEQLFLPGGQQLFAELMLPTDLGGGLRSGQNLEDDAGLEFRFESSMFRNVSITLRHFGEKFRLQEEARRPLPTVAVGG